jgi:predicted extracellular nuclease
MSRSWRLLMPLLLSVALATTAIAPAVVVAATWPPSPDLVVGEVVTGGETGSDEYLELYNAGATPTQLGGLEVVYASASGKTVTRKQKWSDRQIGPGERLLLAN